MTRRPFVTALVLLGAGLLVFALPAAAEPRTTSDLLLPYFEVDLGGPRTTLFAVGNAHDQAVEVRVSVDTNWGIPVLGVTLDLDPGQVRTVNLRDWIERGELPNRNLGPAELADVQAALAGQPSPRDGMYYGAEVEPGLMAGAVTLRILSQGRPDVLWGDYFWVDPAGNSAEAELLVDIGLPNDCNGLCDRHLVRFLEGGAFDGGTELIVWTGRRFRPSPTPEPAHPSPLMISGEAFYEESGAKFDERILDLLPAQALPLASLGLTQPFGWIDVASHDPIYLGVRYKAEDRFAVAIQSWCVEEPAGTPPFRPRPSIDVQKLTAGADADAPPGPGLEIGSTVVWEYVVTNTGNVRLTDVVVSDNRGVTVTCPRSSLGAGERMVCSGSGTVVAGQYGNIGTVTASPREGSPVTDSDPSHYLGVPFIVTEPAISIEKLTNGQDADTPPGPSVSQGSPVTWTYVVTNTGGVELTGVTVTDSDPAVSVSCPKTALAIGQSMMCSAAGTAEEGQYANVGTAAGTGSGEVVSDSDPSHYFGLPEIVTDFPDIEIEKLTNGFDADGVASAPHLTHGHPVIWTYVVTNTGNVALSNVTVTDDQGVQVSCPTTTLEPGEQMLCTGSGTAVASEECYANVGTVVGTPPEGDNVTDSDPSHYCAEEIPGEPAIDIEKYTNEYDADQAPGPTLTEGDNVQWVYVVTNTGDVTLTGVTVADDQPGVSITCDGVSQPFVLDPGEQVVCFANGTAMVGQYENLGTAQGTPEGGGDPVSDTDPSHYFGEELVEEPAIDLEKRTNGEDADTPTGPALTVGDPVTWTYVVTNTGNVALTNVTVTDDQSVVVICPKATLDPGESMTCIGTGVAEAGQYANIGTAEGDGGGTTVSDTDPSHYLGEEEDGDEGCTPGYWKNHPSSWLPTGYTTGQSLVSVFAEVSTYPTLATATLLDGLGLAGGPGVDGAAEILLRAGVAALLNAAHPVLSYPLSEAQVISQVNAALASGSRDAMLLLAANLDWGNNLGCPLGGPQ